MVAVIAYEYSDDLMISIEHLLSYENVLWCDGTDKYLTVRFLIFYKIQFCTFPSKTLISHHL